MEINRQPLREQVRIAIVESILSGDIEPGERLVELKIAERLGVSQAPVREALRDLEAIGLVNSIPNRGTFAGDFGRHGMREIFQVRGALEELATRIATPLLSDDTSELQAQVDAMRAAAQNEDVDGVTVHSEIFHRLIVDAADNSVLASVWRGLDIHRHTAVVVRQQQVELLAIAESHQPIVDAISSGDVELACQITRHHQDDLDSITSSAS